ncbi:MAG: hypothetical protein Fur0037_25210 [Planctomycetota bacterium]
MKRILAAAAVVLATGIGFLPVLDDPPLATSAYLVRVSQHQAVLRMVTAAPQDLVAVVSRDGVETWRGRSAGRRRHEFRCEGLDPGAEYAYRISRADGAACDEGRIRTPPSDDRVPVRFAVVGDSGKVPWWVWLQRSPLFHLPARLQWLPAASMVSRIGRRIAESSPDFLLHVGDIVYPKGLQGHWSAAFFRPFGEVIRNAPVYAVCGNHDVVDDGGRQLLANLAVPGGGSATADGRSWSMAWGSVRVVGLDLNPRCGTVATDEEGDRVAAAGPVPCLDFLEDSLRTASEPWVVVVAHFPILSASRQGDRADLQRQLLPLLAKYRVDCYFSGHDHAYERFGPIDGVTLVVTGGGGKSLYATRERESVRFVRSSYHFCRVEVNADSLILSAIDPDGAAFDSVVLRKSLDGLDSLSAVNPARAERIRRLLH